MRLVHHELSKGIEIESYLEPVWDFHNGREIVVIIRSQTVKNQNLQFFTDSNGYYMEKRTIGQNNGVITLNDIPVASNYYPMNSAFYIEDQESDHRLTVMTDRAQGVTSLKPGEMEIMVHRVTNRDDWKGLGELFYEKDQGQPIRVSTRHFLIHSAPSKISLISPLIYYR